MFLLIPGILCLLWGLAAYALDRFGRRPLPPGSFDGIIVPGCAVWPGEVPSPALARRTRHAVRLFHAGFAPAIVFTGGVGKSAPAEAMVAARLAATLGVPDDAVLLECDSTSTAENARFAARLSDDNGPIGRWKVLIATDGYHCWRCERLFGQHFAQARAAGSQPGPRQRLRGALREVVSIVKMGLR
jgi:uncharacterized SAM-binding protein YcdF (DUF218 family)